MQAPAQRLIRLQDVRWIPSSDLHAICIDYGNSPGAILKKLNLLPWSRSSLWIAVIDTSKLCMAPKLARQQLSRRSGRRQWLGRDLLGMWFLEVVCHAHVQLPATGKLAVVAPQIAWIVADPLVWRFPNLNMPYCLN